MRRFGDGLAVGPDLGTAARRAAAAALGAVDGAPDLVCVFACSDDAEAVEAAGRVVAEVAGGATVVGCSASGVIGAGGGVEDGPAVSVWAARLPGARVRGFHLEVIRLPEGMAVVGMPERLLDDEVVLLFADPYSFPADGFVEQSNSVLTGLPIVGGLAAGPGGRGSTRLFLDDRAVDRGAVGVVLGGAVGAVPVVSQGCRPVGPTMVVTKAEGNAVLELAGTPALTKLEQIVAELDAADQALVTGGGLHFGVAMDEYVEEHGPGDFLVRGVLGVEAERGALVIGDDVEVGRTVRFQLRDAAAASGDLAATLARCSAPPAGDVDGVVLVSCNGRGAHLFGSSDHDARLVRDALGGPAVGGFFAGGEFGPVAGRNHLHGFTASLLAFRNLPGEAS